MMFYPLQQGVHKRTSDTFPLKLRINSQVADDGTIDFVSECPTGSDQFSLVKRRHDIPAVLKSGSDFIRCSPAELHRSVQLSQ